MSTLRPFSEFAGRVGIVRKDVFQEETKRQPPPPPSPPPPPLPLQETISSGKLRWHLENLSRPVLIPFGEQKFLVGAGAGHCPRIVQPVFLVLVFQQLRKQRNCACDCLGNHLLGFLTGAVTKAYRGCVFTNANERKQMRAKHRQTQISQQDTKEYLNHMGYLNQSFPKRGDKGEVQRGTGVREGTRPEGETGEKNGGERVGGKGPESALEKL